MEAVSPQTFVSLVLKPRNVNTRSLPGQTRDCLDPWFQPFIQTNGDVWPCCWFHQEALGNLNKTPFNDILNGPEFFSLRSELLSGELRKVCIECPSRGLTTPEKLLKRLRQRKMATNISKVDPSNDDLRRGVLEKHNSIEKRPSALKGFHAGLHAENRRSRARPRRSWLQPPMWTFEQYSPRSVDLSALPGQPALPAPVPSIAIVTPSYNQGRYLRAAIDSVLSQNYPKLFYHIQDAASDDGTIDVLKSYGNKISWKSEPDKGQSDAINIGFNGVESEIMCYLNSDDTLLPGTLAYVANFFHRRPDVDIVYGHRIFINNEGSEIGRAVFPPHSTRALLHVGYIPQETMFWRRRVWDAIGNMDCSFQYALDWDFELRAQAAGFKFERASRFMACFRVHDQQKTASNYHIGRLEMDRIRKRYLGSAPSQLEIYRAISPYLARQFIFHWGYLLRLWRG
ncbi:MAG: glycosyltransferase [Xanthobacteraceae bacterium]|nr:glycosyltransferase [Xanthobacteraceae bacterium]